MVGREAFRLVIALMISETFVYGRYTISNEKQGCSLSCLDIGLVEPGNEFVVQDNNEC